MNISELLIIKQLKAGNAYHINNVNSSNSR